MGREGGRSSVCRKLHLEHHVKWIGVVCCQRLKASVGAAVGDPDKLGW